MVSFWCSHPVTNIPLNSHSPNSRFEFSTLYYRNDTLIEKTFDVRYFQWYVSIRIRPTYPAALGLILPIHEYVKIKSSIHWINCTLNPSCFVQTQKFQTSLSNLIGNYRFQLNFSAYFFLLCEKHCPLIKSHGFTPSHHFFHVVLSNDGTNVIRFFHKVQ